MTLARGLSEADAQEISAELNRRGVAVSRRPEGTSGRYTLQISQSAVPLAWQALDERRRAPAAPSAQRSASPLVPTREAERRAREHAASAQLSHALEGLPGVHSAQVVLALPRAQNQLDDLLEPASAPPAQALVSLSHDAAATPPSEASVRALVKAVAPGISDAAIRVDTQARAATPVVCAELSQLGPLTVTSASVHTLKLWIVISLGVHMLCSLALLFMLQRRRRPDPNVPSLAQPKR